METSIVFKMEDFIMLVIFYIEIWTNYVHIFDVFKILCGSSKVWGLTLPCFSAKENRRICVVLLLIEWHFEIASQLLKWVSLIRPRIPNLIKEKELHILELWARVIVNVLAIELFNVTLINTLQFGDIGKNEEDHIEEDNDGEYATEPGLLDIRATFSFQLEPMTEQVLTLKYCFNFIC